ncbi:MAG: hypothetical protein QG604_493 [Candidatus Dependentiae bacterium]|nr:hypothetical protein [Candidatus Dependentiae bacterium]
MLPAVASGPRGCSRQRSYGAKRSFWQSRHTDVFRLPAIGEIEAQSRNSLGGVPWLACADLQVLKYREFNRRHSRHCQASIVKPRQSSTIGSE